MNRSRTEAMPLNPNAPEFESVPEGFIGMKSETIVLETREFDLSTEDPAPTTVKRRLTLKNPIRKTTVELAIFHEHYLMARLKRNGTKIGSRLINLRYLDARPELSRSVARKMLHASMALFFGALLAGLMSYYSILVPFSIVSAGGLIVASGFFLWLYAYRTIETVMFRTAIGRAPAFAVRANPGCIRACRALVPVIVQDIVEARRTRPSDSFTYLRREMREHYRLQEIGVLSMDACRDGTRRILEEFDSDRVVQP